MVSPSIYDLNGIVDTTPEQSSLLERPTFVQYPTEQEFSESKGSKKRNRSNRSGGRKTAKIELLVGTLVKPKNGDDPSTNNSTIGAKLLNGVEKSYGKGEKLLDSSKVVDENGEPLAVSHATDNDFTVFDKSKAGENTDSNVADEHFAKKAHRV